MKAGKIRYLVGAAMLCMAVYQALKPDIWECLLYATAGAAFITMALLTDNVFPGARKLLNVLSWVLIIAAVLIFLFVLQFVPKEG